MSCLSLVVWSAGPYQFALTASQVNELRPYTTDANSASLHQLISGIPVEPLLFCLGWTTDGQPCSLAVSNEPQHVELPLADLWPLPALLQHARQHPAIRALAWHLGQPLILLDARQLSMPTANRV